MTRFHIAAKNPWLFVIPVIISLVLVASLAIFPVQADEPEGAKKAKLAPLNPKFLAFRQNPPAEFYGYIPHTLDLTHLKDIPVKKRAHLKRRSLPKSFAWGGKVTWERHNLPEPLALGDNTTSEPPDLPNPFASGDNATSEPASLPQSLASGGKITSGQLSLPQSLASGGKITSGQLSLPQSLSPGGKITSGQLSLPQSLSPGGKITSGQLSLPQSLAPGGTVTSEQYDAPDPFDWGDNVTSVKDQGACGTCWAFGTTAVLESAVLISEGMEYDFSEQSVTLCVDRSWVYLYDESDEPCNGGGNSFRASEVFIKKGSVLETCNPYDTTLLRCKGDCTCDTCAPVKKVNGYRYVTGDESQTGLIKEAVYDHGPVTMSFYYHSNWLYTDDPNFGYIYDYVPPPARSTNHLVSIIGWDDDVPHPNPSHSGTGAWLVKNSWGTSWGNDGYFWLAYNSSCMGGIAYLEYEDYDPNIELLYWDEAGLVGAISYDEIHNYAWMANIFTMEQDGNLTHVDFWTTSNNAAYEIYVYDDGNPSNGLQNLLASQTGECAEMGYYSIPLNSAVPLENGQQFTIAVKMTTPDYLYPIAVEGVISGTCEPDIQTGVSYIRLDEDTDWSDLEGDGCNACLRAKVYQGVIPEISVSILPGSINYGILKFGTAKNTIDLGSNLKVRNDGMVNEDFRIKSGNAITYDGTDWILITEGTPAEDQFKHECSVPGDGWTAIGSDYGGSMLTDVAPDEDRALDLQITMPSSATDGSQHTIIVTILAVASEG